MSMKDLAAYSIGDVNNVVTLMSSIFIYLFKANKNTALLITKVLIKKSG